MRFFLIVIVGMFVSSCIFNKQFVQKKRYDKLLKLEKEIVNEELNINKEKAQKLYSKAIEFNNKYPNNKYRESVYVIAAKCSDGLNWNDKNIELIDKLILEFPLSNNCSNYLYNKGKIYEEKLNEIEKAILIYNEIIKKYPHSKIAKNLVDYLDFLNKTEKEQFIFLKKND